MFETSKSWTIYKILRCDYSYEHEAVDEYFILIVIIF